MIFNYTPMLLPDKTKIFFPSPAFSVWQMVYAIKVYVGQNDSKHQEPIAGLFILTQQVLYTFVGMSAKDLVFVGVSSKHCF